jgi:hypothetical protein
VSEGEDEKGIFAGQPQLRADTRAVVLDRADADKHQLSDLLIGFSVGDQR